MVKKKEVIFMYNTRLCIPKLKWIDQVTCLTLSYQVQTFVHAEAMLSSEVADTQPCICSEPESLPLISDCLQLFPASYTIHKGAKKSDKKIKFLPN